MERPVVAPERLGQHREHHGAGHDGHQLERQANQVACDRVGPQLAHVQPAAEQQGVQPVGAKRQNATDQDPASKSQYLARGIAVPAQEVPVTRKEDVAGDGLQHE